MIAALALAALIHGLQPATAPQQPASVSTAAAAPREAWESAPAQMDTLAPPPIVRPFEMPAYAPVTPMPYARVAPDPSAAVTVERYRGDYEPPKDELQSYYEEGVRGRFLAEQALRGPLDGVWTVADADGRPIYALVLNDPGLSGGLEAAWRSLAAAPGPSARGVADLVTRSADGLSLSFTDPVTSAPVTLTLRPQGDGRWRGELASQSRRQTAVMTRSTTPS